MKDHGRMYHGDRPLMDPVVIDRMQRRRALREALAHARRDKHGPGSFLAGLCGRLGFKVTRG